MSWLKEVIVDIAATVLIIIAVLIEEPILTGIVLGYTGLLLLIKFLVLVGDEFLNMMNKTNTDAPKWFAHLLYAINTVVLLFFNWWYAGTGWAIIWILSFLTQRKLDKRKPL
jgi:hypothetical protein